MKSVLLGGVIVTVLLSKLMLSYKWNTRDWQFLTTGMIVMFYIMLCVGAALTERG